eukprot:TRINITY_DN1905_c0_g1_i1.p1 TRINITY_DN1905_c0_g1~~TRINITY_DN1905_c0_g1_i1.p1  ORF type:complete len:161 (+),score=23.96 TRINITY_DN1905_c0_g1_i1:95-577(+)
MSILPTPPSYIEHKNMRFLIFDAPTDANLDMYLKTWKKHSVTHIVRACESSYSTEQLEANDIAVFDMAFPDGGFPQPPVVSEWLQLLKSAFKKGEDNTIGVHCVAGLGRAPVLVAIALIESGMDYDDAVNLIRERRRGAINAKQLKWLKSYKPEKKCAIM